MSRQFALQSASPTIRRQASLLEGFDPSYYDEELINTAVKEVPARASLEEAGVSESVRKIGETLLRLVGDCLLLAQCGGMITSKHRKIKGRRHATSAFGHGNHIALVIVCALIGALVVKAPKPPEFDAEFFSMEDHSVVAYSAVGSNANTNCSGYDMMQILRVEDKYCYGQYEQSQMMSNMSCFETPASNYTQRFELHSGGSRPIPHIPMVVCVTVATLLWALAPQPRTTNFSILGLNVQPEDEITIVGLVIDIKLEDDRRPSASYRITVTDRRNTIELIVCSACTAGNIALYDTIKVKISVDNEREPRSKIIYAQVVPAFDIEIHRIAARDFQRASPSEIWNCNDTVHPDGTRTVSPSRQQAFEELRSPPSKRRLLQAAGGTIVSPTQSYSPRTIVNETSSPPACSQSMRTFLVFFTTRCESFTHRCPTYFSVGRMLQDIRSSLPIRDSTVQLVGIFKGWIMDNDRLVVDYLQRDSLHITVVCMKTEIPPMPSKERESSSSSSSVMDTPAQSSTAIAMPMTPPQASNNTVSFQIAGPGSIRARPYTVPDTWTVNDMLDDVARRTGVNANFLIAIAFGESLERPVLLRNALLLPSDVVNLILMKLTQVSN